MQRTLTPRIVSPRGGMRPAVLWLVVVVGSSSFARRSGFVRRGSGGLSITGPIGDGPDLKICQYEHSFSWLLILKYKIEYYMW